jgi:hypothetical protein
MADIPQVLNQPIFNAPPPSGGSWVVPVAVAVIAAIAAFMAAWIAHSAKVSEFRQAWINDLRKDIADYISVAERWHRKNEEISEVPNKEERESKELFPIANEARALSRRIKMRFNPRENRYRTEDDSFLRALDDLLNPGLRNPRNPDTSWDSLANRGIEQAREILKREWEVTKKLRLPLRPWLRTNLQ